MITLFQEDKAWFGKVKDKYVIVIAHITKIDRTFSKGMSSYFYPPRIGIDFYLPEDYPNGPHDFIPNLELGDIARLMKILELAGEYKIFTSLNWGRIKPFKIGLAFESDLQRRIIVSARSKRLILKYEGYHKGKKVEIEYCFTRKGVQKFVEVLKELTIEYMNFIQRYVLIGKVDPKFK